MYGLADNDASDITVATSQSHGATMTASPRPLAVPEATPHIVPAEPTQEPAAPAPVPGQETPSAPQPSADAQVDVLTALDAARTLEMKGRAQANDYDRDLFGQRWADVDRNGCDTRNDVLRRDLTDVEVKPGTQGCLVLSGTLLDPYSGSVIDFVRGQGTSELVQIDHVVALADAWQKGAREWTDEQRTVFANDPLNLLAVNGELNQQKGAGDAATWLPPNRGYWCPYAARLVAVKSAYDLWVTPAESSTLISILEDCPEEPIPVATW